MVGGQVSSTSPCAPGTVGTQVPHVQPPSPENCIFYIHICARIHPEGPVTESQPLTHSLSVIRQKHKCPLVTIHKKGSGEVPHLCCHGGCCDPDQPRRLNTTSPAPTDRTTPMKTEPGKRGCVLYLRSCELYPPSPGSWQITLPCQYNFRMRPLSRRCQGQVISQAVMRMPMDRARGCRLELPAPESVDPSVSSEDVSPTSPESRHPERQDDGRTAQPGHH